MLRDFRPVARLALTVLEPDLVARFLGAGLDCLTLVARFLGAASGSLVSSLLAAALVSAFGAAAALDDGFGLVRL